MYKCHFCKKSVPPRTPCSKVVTRVKMFNHPFRPRVQKRWTVDKSGRNKIEWRDDQGGTGVQIVQEVESCPDCAKARTCGPLLVKI